MFKIIEISSQGTAPQVEKYEFGRLGSIWQNITISKSISKLVATIKEVMLINMFGFLVDSHSGFTFNFRNMYFEQIISRLDHMLFFKGKRAF